MKGSSMNHLSNGNHACSIACWISKLGGCAKCKSAYFRPPTAQFNVIHGSVIQMTLCPIFSHELPELCDTMMTMYHDVYCDYFLSMSFKIFYISFCNCIQFWCCKSLFLPSLVRVSRFYISSYFQLFCPVAHTMAHCKLFISCAYGITTIQKLL